MMKRFSGVLVIFVAFFATLPTLADDDAARERRRTPVVEVFESCRDAVVNVNTTKIIRHRRRFGSAFDDIFNFGPRRSYNQKVQSVGSGAVIHELGYVVTNAHVIAQAFDVSVTFADNTTLPAEIVVVDGEHDLAVLKINADRPLPYLELGKPNDIMIGETVVAIGNPLGLHHTVTTGIVSAMNRTLDFGNDTAYHDLIQTDTAINPGNSGGPLLNINSELIGINTAIRGDAQNIGFAIPVSKLWNLLPSLLDIERQQRVKFGMEVGAADAHVTSVSIDSPAAKAEIKVGDSVIELNGDPVRDGIDFYLRMVSRKPGDQIALKIRRGKKILEKVVALEPIPLPDGNALASKLLGIELREIPANVRRRYRLPDNARLIVETVEQDSPADRVGMQPGDLITRLDRVPILTLTDVGLVLESLKAGESVVISGIRPEPMFSWEVPVPTRGE